MARTVGIKDVAAAAGVSITTVSHALNGKGRLTSETRERVRAAAERLGYQPSALARGLAGGRTGILALTVSLVDDAVPVADFDYFLQVMSAATSAALESGYSLVLLPADRGSDTLDRLPLDGAIIVDPVRADPVAAHLRARNVPLVTTGRVPDDPPGACWVDNDHVAGTRAILDHLAETGAERIALLTAPAVSSYTIDALSAYDGWCAEHDMTPRVAVVTETPSEGSAFASALELLESEDPPDAIYATLDRLALGVLLAAEAKGARVPEDLRIAGCSDSEASRSARPALTAVSVNPELLGREAVELLITLVEHGPPEDRHRMVPIEIIPRGSTQAAVPRRRRLRAG